MGGSGIAHISTSNRTTSIAQGAIWLTGAVMISKLIGVLQKIPLQNIAGDYVFGIYNAVYPIYQLIIVLATAGIPTAISIIVAQQQQLEPDQVKITLRVAIMLLSICGLVSASIMWLSSDSIALLLGEPKAALAIRSLAPAVALAALAAAFRGFYQGTGLMALSAGSQVLEQLVRVTVMLAVLLHLSATITVHTAADVTAAVMRGSAFGAASACIWLIVAYLRREGRQSRVERQKAKQLIADRSYYNIMKQLLTVAMPVVLGAAVVPILAVVDAITIPSMLHITGYTSHEAMTWFGIYSRVQPLIQLIVMVVGALGASMIPRLVQQHHISDLDNKQQSLIGITFLLKLTIVISSAAAVGLLCLADEINMMLYKNIVGHDLFAWLAWTTIGSSILSILPPLLQSLGASRTPLLLLLFAAFIKAGCNVIFIKQNGLIGGAYVAVIVFSVIAICGLWLLYKKMLETGLLQKQQLRIRALVIFVIKLFFSLSAMTVLILLSKHLFQSTLDAAYVNRMQLAVYVVVVILVSAAIYIMCIWKWRIIDQTELQWVGRKSRRER